MGFLATTINAELAEPAETRGVRLLGRIIHERFERLGAFVSKTVGAGRLDHTKNAAENDRARRP
jgi:hypothetical protein